MSSTEVHLSYTTPDGRCERSAADLRCAHSILDYRVYEDEPLVWDSENPFMPHSVKSTPPSLAVPENATRARHQRTPISVGRYMVAK